MATQMTTTPIESKVSKVVTHVTLVKETDTHIFKIDNVDLNDTTSLSTRLRGLILHKNGTHCGDFVINNFGRKTLSVNIDMSCRTLLGDLLLMLDDLDANKITPVDEFSYISTTSNEVM
jgi:hypothetical protein